jgi:plastocyanin
MSHRRRVTAWLASLALAATIVLAACSGSTTGTPADGTGGTTAPPASGTAGPSGTSAVKTVAMKDFSFKPAELEVTRGTAVQWTNQDGAAHTVVADDGSFKSPELATGQVFKFTFAKAGTFTYKCTIHPSMVGQIIVK